MVCQPVRLALLIGAIIAVAVSPARADNAPCTTAPATRTIQVMECVPETYKVKRTRYKVECRQEEYDTCKYVCEPVVQEKVVTCVKRVPVMKTVTQKCCQTVRTTEKRVVMKNCYKKVPTTVMKKKLVSLGHWECREHKSLFSGLCNKGCGNSCGSSCDPCGSSCGGCAPACEPVRMKKHWVFCPQYECCPVTVCKRVCYQVPTEVCVPVCKQVWSEKQVQVCTYQCVEEKKVVKCTVNVRKKVTCKATRTVRVCVPYEVEETCTRMVQRCVTREVPCAPVCQPACQPTCEPCCRGPRFGGLFHRSCCETSCDTGCNTGCDTGCGRTRCGGLRRGCCN